MSPAVGFKKQGLACAIGGVAYFLGFVGFGQFYLAWVCFLPLLWAISNVTPRRALGLGALYGGIAMLGGYYWVIHLLREFAHLPLPLAMLGYLLLCAYQGFSLGVIAFLTRWLAQHARWPAVWALPVALVVVEPWYPFLFPHFFGNSQYRFLWITQIVELSGMVGLGALLGLINGALYELLNARLERRSLVPIRLVLPLGLTALALIFGVIRIGQMDARSEAAPKIDVALIQTNLGARDKRARREEFIRRHLEMSRQAEAEHPELDLLVWP
ncbi:MAG: hypothetical protein KC492_10615, partial [Myxococcales bacterium]|nr:hypothetical protein [Myxococcales bacterium]